MKNIVLCENASEKLSPIEKKYSHEFSDGEFPPNAIQSTYDVTWFFVGETRSLGRIFFLLAIIIFPKAAMIIASALCVR